MVTFRTHRIPTPDARPYICTEGADGNLWFTEIGDPGQIGRITPAGVITEFATGLTNNSAPDQIVAGPDGNLWFTEQKNPGRAHCAQLILVRGVTCARIRE